ncbi:MAG: FkbM family methyltransferase [Alphaproteobacteria bacterium]|nr:MAG: FkbM family methyltransferase [Alphaproteobacteria bacterium]
MNPQQHQSEGASSEVSARLKPPRDLLISYAQNFEDVLLHRVFANVDHGFYVDIGAFDPVIGSVTKIFYDRGWNGINIEPGSAFDRLAAARPRDINLKVAILDERGTVTFVENTADPGASHIDSSVGAEHGGKTQSYSVPCDRLDHVLAEHADGRIINFMKIDAEGSETRILRSTNWREIRPRVLLIEAVAPWTNELVSQDWEPMLLASGYKRAYFDGLNLFFVRDEDAGLLQHFDRPVNALDWFAKYDPVKDKALTDVEDLRRLNWELEVKLFDSLRGIAAQLARVPPRLRGLSEEVETKEGSVSPPDLGAFEPAQLVRQTDIALDYTRRYHRMAKELEEALERRRGLAAETNGAETRSVSETEPSPPIGPEQLQQKLEAAIEAAIRCDRIVGELRDPGGSRALRVALPLARLVRGTRTLAAEGLAAATPTRAHTLSGGGASRLRAGLSRLMSIPGRVARRVFRPIAVRTRAFMLEPLDPIAGNLESIARDIQAIRHALADPQLADRLSPELARSIEALLLTVAVCEPRR